MPDYIREVIEQLAFSAREDKKVDKRSGVSQRLPISVLENVSSNAERRALMAGESVAVPRVLDIYAALPSITGKLELEYEGELKGGDAVARELIRLAVGKVFTGYFDGENLSQVVQWFELGGSLKLDEAATSEADGEGVGRHSGADGEDRQARSGRKRAGCGSRRRRPNLFSKDCTRIAASAATRKPGFTAETAPQGTAGRAARKSTKRQYQ